VHIADVSTICEPSIAIHLFLMYLFSNSSVLISVVLLIAYSYTSSSVITIVSGALYFML
jgi:hypothetical protein